MNSRDFALGAALPTASAQIHVPDVAPPVDERRASATAAMRAVLGSTLPVGTMTLVYLVMVEERVDVELVLPATALAALMLAFGAGVLAYRGVFPRVSTRASWALLFGGVAFFAPLALHQLVALPSWEPTQLLRKSGPHFVTWVKWSTILVGPTHLVFAALCARRGWVGNKGPHLAAIWGVAVVATTWPILFYGGFVVLPMAYVAATAALLLAGLKMVERRRRHVSNMSA